MASGALGQVAPRGTDSSRNHRLLLTKEGRDRVWLGQSPPPPQPPPLAWSEERQYGGTSCCLSTLARSFCPGLRAMYQICLRPPRHSHCLPVTSQESPTHPPLVRLKPYRHGRFCLPRPQEYNSPLLTSFFLLPAFEGGRQLLGQGLSLPCLPGPRAILDRVSFTRALSPAFLTCRASFCLGSCNTKGICAHSPSLVLSIVSRVRHPPLQSWLQAPGFPCPSQGPEPRSLRREVGGNLSSFLPDTLPSLLPSGPCALHPCVPSLSKLSYCLAPRRGRRPQRSRCPLLVSCLPPLPLAPQGDLHRPAFSSPSMAIPQPFCTII